MKITPSGFDLSLARRWPIARRLFAALAITLGAAAAVAQTYSITTLAGQPNSPGTADGTGGAARFSNPQSVTADTAGNIYVADANSHIIRRITPAGVVTTVAGAAGTSGSADGTGGPGGTARFNAPQGVAVDSAGNKLYVSDTNNHTIRVIDLAVSPVQVTTLAGTAGAAGHVNSPGTAARFNFPVGIAFASDGNLWIADTGNHNIRRINTAGVVVITGAGPDGTGGNTPGTSGFVDSATPAAVRFNLPFGVAVDNTRVFVADKNNHRIRVITIATGATTTLAGTGTGGSTDAPSGPATSAAFNGPGAVASDSNGSAPATYLVVADSLNHTLRRITLSSGAVVTAAGSAGVSGFADGLGSAARFVGPLGIALDTAGNVYVADTNNQLIRKGSAAIAPAITSANNATFSTAAAGTFTVTATGTPAPTFSITSGTLPAGVSLNATTGVLAGTAAAAGTFPITIQASNGVSPVATQNFTLTVQQPPTITSANTTAFTINTAGSFQVTATGSPAPTFSITAGTLPGSVGSMNASGLITALPPTTAAGAPFTFTITATNAAGTNSQVFTLNVNEPPAITSANNATFSTASSGTFTVTATGTPAPTFTVVAGSLPAGVTLNATTGVLSGQAAAPGSFPVTIQASNGVSPAATQSFTLTVQQPPTITSTNNTAFAVNTAGTFQVQATGSPAPTFAITAGTLPASVATFNASGLLTATPPTSTTGSPFTFTITATNAAGSNSQVFTLTVQNGAAISGQPANQAVPIGQPATFTVVANGTPSPNSYQWYRQAANTIGFFPLSEGAPYSGTTGPVLSVSGTSLSMSGDQFQVVVSNGIGSPVTSQAATLTVTQAPVFSSANAATFVVNQAGQFQVVASGSPAPTFAITAGTLPASVATLASTGLLSGVPPSDTGSPFVFTITATNAGGSVSQVFTLNVSPFPLAPGFTTHPSGQSVGVGQTATFTAAATGTPAPSYQWQRQRVGETSFTALAEGGNFSGTTTATLTVTNVEAVMSGDQFSVVAANVNGTATSNPAQLTVTLGSVFSTMAGLPTVPGSTDATGLAARFSAPNAVAADSSGNLYIADAGNHVIRKITSAGVVTTLAGVAGQVGSADGAPATARFNSPSAIAVDSAGTVYVADTGNHTIRAVASNGFVSTLAGTAGSIGTADGVGAAARFAFPQGIAVDSAGLIWVSDTVNHTIRRIGASNSVTTFAGTASSSGTADGTAGAARFFFPAALVVDATFNLYVVDSRNHTIRKITSGAVVTTLAGTGGSSGSADGTGSAARFNQPQGIALDSGGTLFVADTLNHTIRRVSSAGAVTTIAGTAGQSGAVDGAGSTVRFNQPYGIAVDTAGTLYVTDTLNHTIRRSGATSAPTITSDPQSVSVNLGAGATFSVSASGTPAPTYQWQRRASGTADFISLSNSGVYSGVNTATLTVLSTTAEMNGDEFRVVVNNLVPPAATSGNAVLAVVSNVAPTIGSQPTGATVGRGESIALSVSATGPAPITYQWLRNGEIITGATSSTLVINNAQAANAGVYTVVVANAHGSVTSSTATVVVNAPPAFTEQPRTQSVQTGGSVTFSAGVAGTGITYQWRRNGTAIAGATNSTLTLTSVAASDAGNYDVIVANAQGSVTSSLAQLTVSATPVAPLVTLHPASRTLLVGASTTLTTAASGVPTPTYQWRLNGTAIAGATNAAHVLNNVQSGDAGVYDVVVTNSAGATTSAGANVRVIARSYAGTYFGSFAGDQGRFAIYVRPDNTGVFLGYLPGSTAPVMSLNILVDDNGNFTFGQNAIVSASLSGEPPRAAALGAVTVSGTIAANGTVTGSVSGGTSVGLSATRAPDSGATQAVAGFYKTGASGGAATALTITSADGQAFVLAQSGATIDGGAGTVDSSGQVAVSTGRTSISESISANSGTVTATTSGAITSTQLGASEALLATQRLANISSRARVGAGDAVGIAGFVIAGEESKPVLIRAVGPTLAAAPFNISGALMTPRVDVFRSTGGTSQLVASNANVNTGGNVAAITAAGQQAFAFPLASGAADSALLLTLPPGAYTAVVSSTATTGTGVALVEVYDLSATTAGQKLLNISTRANAGTGENTLIAGVVVTGSVPKRVLIRAVGPALANFGVQGTLAQPALTVVRDGATVASNTNWTTSPDLTAISAASAQVGAFPLVTGDSAVVVSLAPGNYTAQVTGVGGTSGVALIEVYELP